MLRITKNCLQLPKCRKVLKLFSHYFKTANVKTKGAKKDSFVYSVNISQTATMSQALFPVQLADNSFTAAS